MRLLGLESSCDETAAAIVDDGPRLVANAVSTQIATHRVYGGVVPEVASREHLTRLVHVVDEALAQARDQHFDAVAVTQGPGLVGALLVGVQFAKGLALGRDLPWLGVNHLEGHLAASLLLDTPPPTPHLALLVSGGHTQLIVVRSFGEYDLLGATRDDAAGEAFDKVAKKLGLGYPGGVEIEKLAESGDRQAFELPRGLDRRDSRDFSFSGLKTAASKLINDMGSRLNRADFCASFQEAICDILTKKAVRAARQLGLSTVVLAGGVAANRRLRQLLAERAELHRIRAVAPPKTLCTDNAAMIAAAGWIRLRRGETSDWTASVRSRYPLSGLGP